MPSADLFRFILLPAALVLIACLQVWTLRQVRRRDNMFFIFDRMERVRELRELVQQAVGEWKKLDGSRDIEKLFADEKTEKAARTVCRAFDMLGVLDRHGVVNRRVVDEFYAGSFVRLWEDGLGEWVRDQQKPEKRGPEYLWELAEFYERVRHVPEHHPVRLKTKEWERWGRRTRRQRAA